MTPLRKFSKRAMKIPQKVLFNIKRRFDADFMPIFICGVAGSGTTLLTGLLDQQYSIAANVRESARWVPVTSKLFIKPIAEYKTLDSYRADLFIQDNATAAEIFADTIALYREHVRFPKVSNLVLDKAPNAHLFRAARMREAFPNSKFIFIFRDPVSSIEGWKRKWPLFDQSDLGELCDFWAELHELFSRDANSFMDDVIGISYQRLVDATDDVLGALEIFCGLRQRDNLLEYQNIANQPGKGLRNVVDGKIEIVSDSSAQAYERLAADQVEYIETQLLPVYKQLIQNYSITAQDLRITGKS